MGSSKINTLLPLDRWVQVVGLDPRHFRQVHTHHQADLTCQSVWKEHPWQHADVVSRDDVAHAIAMAEDTLAKHLGFRVLPDWEVGEMHAVPRAGDPTLYNAAGTNPQGFVLSLYLDFGYFVEGGVETLALIDDGVAIVYTDDDGDAYPETATISFATTVTDAQEIAVFYPGESEQNWEIRPFKTCGIAGGVCTMTFERQQFVVPDLIEALDPAAVDGDDDANFLPTVDVYRRYNDPEDMCSLIWKPRAGSCSTAACCADTTQSACLVVMDEQKGLVGLQPADYDAGVWTSTVFTEGRAPDRAQIAYRAGWRDMRKPYPLLQMDAEIERAVVYLAMSYLQREVCSCSNVEALFKYWTQDLAYSEPGGGTYRVAWRQLDNPIGTTRAALHAWELIKRRMPETARAANY